MKFKKETRKKSGWDGFEKDGVIFLFNGKLTFVAKLSLLINSSNIAEG